MALGYKVISDGIEYEVVFSGRDELLGPRESIGTPEGWIAPKRQFNKTGKYNKKPKEGTKDGTRVE